MHSQEGQEDTRVRGFAGVLATQIDELNRNEEFVEKYRNIKPTSILLNPTDGRFAALVKVASGHVSVESIRNDPPANLSRRKVGWDGYVACSKMTFLEIAMGRVSMLGMLKKMLTRQLVIKGLGKLLILQKMFSYLTS